MSWAKRDELARIYRFQGAPELWIERDSGYDDYRWSVVVLYRPEEWTVYRRLGIQGDVLVHVCWRSIVQVTMGPWTTLCIQGGGKSAVDATDQEVLAAFFGDESIYQTEPNPTLVPRESWMYVKAYQTPVTFGGSARRLDWQEIPDVTRTYFARELKRRDLDPDACRGLYRITRGISKEA